MLIDMSRKPSAIAQEIRQTKAFDSPEDEAAVALLRTVDLLRADLERALAPRSITPQQYNVLRILRGSHPEPLATLEIADRMIERAPGITRLLDRLEAARLVSRKRCGEDRRIVHCSITREGLAVLAALDEPVREIGQKRVGRLSKSQLANLLQLLDRIREEVS
jgi:DNA-binding MarR family transcriptional regulator